MASILFLSIGESLSPALETIPIKLLSRFFLDTAPPVVVGNELDSQFFSFLTKAFLE